MSEKSKNIVLKEISGSTDRSNLPPIAMDAIQKTMELYQVVGFHPPWCSYLVYADDVNIGFCAFKGQPNQKREVEIAYFCFPEFEGRGFATQMAEQLIAIASKEEGIIVTAQTLPHKNASTSVLQKNGFVKRGIAQDDEVGEVWDWVLPK